MRIPAGGACAERAVASYTEDRRACLPLLQSQSWACGACTPSIPPGQEGSSRPPFLRSVPQGHLGTFRLGLLAPFPSSSIQAATPSPFLSNLSGTLVLRASQPFPCLVHVCVLRACVWQALFQAPGVCDEPLPMSPWLCHPSSMDDAGLEGWLSASPAERAWHRARAQWMANTGRV